MIELGKFLINLFKDYPMTIMLCLLFIILILLLIHILISHNKYRDLLEDITYMSMHLRSVDDALEHSIGNGYSEKKKEKFAEYEAEYNRKNKKDKRSFTINIFKI